MIYLRLFIGFLKVGMFSFGGAYAAIPIIRDIVLSYNWISEDTMAYMIAVSESTPGPIMVNLATYVGSSQAGFLGALVATTAVILPSFVIMLIVAKLLSSLKENPYIQALIGGLKPCIIGIILAMGISMIVKMWIGSTSSIAINQTEIALTLALSVIYFGSRKFIKHGISPLMLIAISAVIGIVVYQYVPY